MEPGGNQRAWLVIPLGGILTEGPAEKWRGPDARPGLVPSQIDLLVTAVQGTWCPGRKRVLLRPLDSICVPGMAVLEVEQPPIIFAGPWQPTRTCIRCGQTLSLVNFPIHRGDHMPRCRPCQNAFRRASKARAAARKLPIPRGNTPAERLRLALVQRRQAGLEWSDELFEAVIVRVCCVAPEGRWQHDSWAAILREQMPIWRDAYQRSGHVYGLSVELMG